MEELLNYIQNRQERIKKLKEIELAKAEECTSSIDSLYIGLKELIEKSCSPIKQIDKDNNLRNYLEEQTRNMHLQFRMRVQNRQEELARAKDQLLKDTARYNIEELIELSDKQKTSSHNSLSRGERAILEFIHAFDNYRLAMQYGELQGEDRLKETKSKYDSLRHIGTEKVKKCMARLIERDLLNASDRKSLYDMLKEIREVSRNQKEIEERANISVILEILNIEDRKTKEKILDNCNYKDLEERVSKIEDLISSDVGYVLLRNNPSLLLESRDRFDKYANNLSKLIEGLSGKDLEDSIKAELSTYSSLDAVDFLITSKENNHLSGGDYNKEMSKIIIELLRKKGYIGNSYIRLENLRRDVSGKIEKKDEMCNFYKNIRILMRTGVIIAHTKKSKTEFPVSLNPHYDEVADNYLKETLKTAIGYNGRN